MKMINTWLIFNLMIPFLEIILTTLNTFYEEDLKDERAAIRVAPIMDSNEDEDGDRDAVSDTRLESSSRERQGP